MSNYIADGQEFEATVTPDKDDVFSPVRFKYRPMSVTETKSIGRKLETASIEKQGEIMFQTVVDRVTWWDIEHDGAMVPISMESLDRLRGGVGYRIATAVIQGRGDAVEESVGN